MAPARARPRSRTSSQPRSPTAAACAIEHDAYYRDQSHLSPEERAAVNYDHPASLETTLLVQHLRRLRAGETVDVPIYDFAHHTRRAETRHVAPAPVIIVEGILVFVEAALREQMDIKIFVDTDADIRLMRRIRRDLEQRGRSSSRCATSTTRRCGRCTSSTSSRRSGGPT